MASNISPARYGLLLGGLTCASLMVFACGSSQDSLARQNQSVGSTKEGAPMAPGVADPGLLQDPATYQPAKIAGTISGGAKGGDEASKGAAVSGDADAQVRAAVTNLVNAIRDGEVELALDLFNPEQVKAFTKDQYNALFDTFERIDQLARRLGPAKANSLLGALRGAGDADLKWDLLDSEHANVTPNVAAVLFGPVKPTPTLLAVKQPDGWKFQLAGPLAAEDVTAIVIYHRKLQTALDQIRDWLSASKQIDENRLKAAVSQALQGQPVDLPSAAPGEAPGAGVGEPGAPGEELPKGAEEPEKGSEEPNSPP